MHATKVTQRMMLHEENYTKACLGDLAVLDDTAAAVHCCV